MGAMEKYPVAKLPAAVGIALGIGATLKATSLCNFDDPFWSKYIVFHAHVRADFERGVKRRALIYDCRGSTSCHGLGGELRTIAWALYASMITKRAFFIQWERNG